ncbi:MAG: PEP-CTERM sorting domain-containing protein [Methylomicrobium sp.]|nr:PEP-CTERM sorting domain-containing protein [Methylomicrobium sp.]
MKIKNLKALALAAVLPSAMMLSGQAQAFIVDDFNSRNADESPLTYNATDNTTGNGGVEVNPTPVAAKNTVWGSLGGGAGITRKIGAELVSGDRVETQICGACQAGHLVSSSALPTDSVGNFFFEWAGPALAGFNAGKYLAFDWGADLAGATWTATVAFGGVDSVFSGGSLPATVPSGSLAHEAKVAIGGTGDITKIRLDFAGVSGLDANIDNVKLVPEPETLAMLGMGLLGIAFRRRRSINAISV